MRGRLALIMAGTLLCALAAGLAGPDTADAWVQDKANGTEETVELVFGSGGGEDDSTTISIPMDVPVYHARMGIGGKAGSGGVHPADVWVDVGKDGDVDWAFAGPGYGALGRQTMFMDNSSSVKVQFEGAGTNESFSIYLPKGAKVTNATVNLTGSSGGSSLGMMVKSDLSWPSAMIASSSDSWAPNRPKLTFHYNGGGSTDVQPDEANSKDARTQAGEATTNFEGTGMDHVLLSSFGGNTSYGFMDFETSGIAMDQVSGVDLVLRVTSYSNPQPFSVHRVLEEWDEWTITWNNKPAHEETALDTQTATTTLSYLTWDVTEIYTSGGSEGYPSDVVLDLGSDDVLDVDIDGELNTTVTSGDLSGELNILLATAPAAFTDEYGNKFAEVPVELSSSSEGYVRVSDINIEYDWSAVVDKNPHNTNLTNEVNEHMESSIPVAGNVIIPINVGSSSAGKVVLGDFNISYNGPPIRTAELPSDRGIDEDGGPENLMDLSEHFLDDHLDSEDLDYEVEWVSPPDLADVRVAGGHHLSVDASRGEYRDLNGEISARVRAVDDLGFYAESKTFVISVWPVNDEPVVGEEDIPDRTLEENSSAGPMKLDNADFFQDVDGDQLIYTVEVDPLDVYEGEEYTKEAGEGLTVDIKEGSDRMTLTAHGDFTGEGIPVRVHADDGIGEGSGAYQDFLVDVTNIPDDAPVWSPLPDIHVEEDGRLDDALWVEDHITDVDTEISKIRFSVVSNSEEEHVRADLAEDRSLDIRTAGENWTGEAVLRLRAVDDGSNIAEAEVAVVVDPVNDLPEVKLQKPGKDRTVSSDEVLLTWTGWDAETPSEELAYTVYLLDGGAQTAKAQGLRAPTYTLEVEDGRAYRWTVAAHDGTEMGEKAEPRTFTVDFGSGPVVQLRSPADGTILKEGEAELSWSVTERPGGLGGEITYDLYVGESPDELVLTEKGLKPSSYQMTGLEDGIAYHWKVVPSDRLGTGACASGTWTFSVDREFTGYGVGLTVSPEAISTTAGGLGAVTASVKNTGGANDTYKLTAKVPGIPGAMVTFEDVGPDGFSLGMGGERDVTVSIEVPGSTRSGDYKMTLKARSVRGGMSETVDVTVTVNPSSGGGTGPGGDEDSQGQGRDASGQPGSYILPILIAAIITIAAAAAGAAVALGRRRGKGVTELAGEAGGSGAGPRTAAAGGRGAEPAPLQLPMVGTRVMAGGPGATVGGPGASAGGGIITEPGPGGQGSDGPPLALPAAGAGTAAPGPSPSATPPPTPGAAVNPRPVPIPGPAGIPTPMPPVMVAAPPGAPNAGTEGPKGVLGILPPEDAEGVE